MSKKVKCIECSKSMHWALTNGVSEKNYEYAKRCIQTARRSIICGETMKTKSIHHEQYCKKFVKKTEMDLSCDECYQKEIEQVEKTIKEYEESCGD